MTGFVPVLWVLWAVSAAGVLALLLYRSNITRYEEDRLFLDDSFEHGQAEQAGIVRRVHQIDPALHVTEAVAALLTMAIVVFYVARAVRVLF